MRHRTGFVAAAALDEAPYRALYSYPVFRCLMVGFVGGQRLAVGFEGEESGFMKPNIDF
jgi:hypothetical protein